MYSDLTTLGRNYKDRWIFMLTYQRYLYLRLEWHTVVLGRKQTWYHKKPNQISSNQVSSRVLRSRSGHFLPLDRFAY